MARASESSSTSTSTRAPADAEPIQVVTAADGAYLPYLAAMLRSIAARSHGEGRVAVTVLHPGIAADAREAATPPGHNGTSVHWLEVDGGLVRRALRTPELPLPMYFRLLVGHMLPAGIARAIYLDADVIVDADLGGLWRRELGNAVAAAVVDYLPRCQDAIANWRELGLDGDAPYYNTGVMLVDVAAWRAADVGARALEVCRANRDHLLARGEFAQNDQYGLNVVLQRRWYTLGTLWNWGSELVECPARIVHYLGHGKPHDPRCGPGFRKLFLEHLGATRWADWVPVTAPAYGGPVATASA